ncbi:MAG: hypothetical protein ACRD2L_06010, partial [Terriglobia bacterium]
MWFGHEDSAGFACTWRAIKRFDRARLINPLTPEELAFWIREYRIPVLNVAGNRESKEPGHRQAGRRVAHEGLDHAIMRPMRMLDNWQKVVHFRNKQSGFYDYLKDITLLRGALKGLPGEFKDALTRVLDDYEKATLERKLFLVVSEICEAHDELRSGKGRNEVYYKEGNPQKPEGFPVELADAQIRLWDIQEYCGIDGEQVAA